MDAPRLPTGTVTFLFTDIEGSTQLWARYPRAMPSALQRHHSVLRQSIETCNGYVFQIIGDAFCAAFSSALDGLQAAITAQLALNAEPWGKTGPLKVRMAIHTGTAEVREGEYTSGEYLSGLTLSRTSRLLSAGHGGQVLLSRATRDLLLYEIPEEVDFLDLGEHRLKGLSHPEQIYQLIHPELAVEFPTLKTLDIHLDNLPLQVTSFVGRKREIKAISKLFTKSRLVTLTGSGGVGKTRLAQTFAHEMIKNYQNGAVFISLAPIHEPELVPAKIAEVLDVKISTDQSLQEMLCNFLAGKEVLLLLDNFEHVLPSASFLAELLLAAPDLYLLVTSRSPLHLSGETILTIKPLDLPSVSETLTGDEYSRRVARSEAVRLFVNRAKAQYPAFRLSKENSRLVLEICQMLDGLPLAIELAASRVREFPLALLKQELSQSLDLLSVGFHDLPDRHQTLRNTFEWSLKHLGLIEQDLFPRLGVFNGGFTFDAVLSIFSSTDRAVLLSAIGRLVDHSMIVRMEEGERYDLLQTCQEYALEQLKTSGRMPEVRRAHLTYYSQLAEEAAPHLWDKEQERWRRRLSSEIDNFRGALLWAFNGETAEAADIELAARMAASLWYFWFSSGSFKEGQRWLAAALNRISQSNKTRARLLTADGTLAWQQGHLQMAGKSIRESMDLFRSLDDLPGLAEATHICGHIVFDQQNYQQAERFFRESLKIYESLDDSINQITLIHDLGLVAFHQIDLSSARKYYKQSLALYLQNGIKDGEASNYIRLGDIDRFEGDYDEADRFYKKGLEIFRELNISIEIACALHKLGFTALHNGENRQAEALFLESLAVQYEVGNQQGIAECFAGLASLKVSNQAFGEAAQLFGASRQILTRTGLPISPADLAEWQRDEAIARSKCASKYFEGAWSKGMEETMEETVASLLGF